MSEQPKDKKRRPNGVSRRKFVQGAASGFVGAALAGMVSVREAAASGASGGLFCPDSGVQIIGICGGKGCTAVLKFPDGHTENLPFGGSGGLGAQSGSSFAVNFKHMIAHHNTLGPIVTQHDVNNPSSMGTGSVTINGQSVTTVTSASINQVFNFASSGHSASVGLTMNQTSASATQLAFAPASGFSGADLGNGYSLQGYSMTVNARPKSGAGNYLLQVVNLTFDGLNSRISFKVEVDSSVVPVNGPISWYAHNPDDQSGSAFPFGTATFSSSNTLSDLITVDLSGYSNVYAGTKIVVEATASADSRHLFNYALVNTSG